MQRKCWRRSCPYKTALADTSFILGVEKSTLQRDIIGTRAKYQLICLPSFDQSTIGSLYDDALINGGKAIRAVVERGEDVCTIPDLRIALFGERWRWNVLLC